MSRIAQSLFTATDLPHVIANMRIDLARHVPVEKLSESDAPALMLLMDEHCADIADDYADILNEISPTLLCDAYGDWCDLA